MSEPYTDAIVRATVNALGRADYIGIGADGDRARALLILDAVAPLVAAEALRAAASLAVRLANPKTAHWFTAEGEVLRSASTAFRDALRARADEIEGGAS